MAKPNPFPPKPAKAGKPAAKPFGKKGAKPMLGDEGFPIAPKGKKGAKPPFMAGC